MKKMLSPLITAILMISSFAALFVGQAPRAYASPDGALSQRFEASGHYEIVSAGIGLDGTTSGTIDLDVPGNVVEAYLYWAGYVARPSDEPLPNPDDYAQVTLTVDANPPVSIEADDHHGPDYWFGTDPEHYHFVFVERVAGAGVTTPLVEAGSHSYTIEGINFTEPYGAGLMVVYEDELLPISYVNIMDGLDSFYQDYEAPRGPDSEVSYFDFSADSQERIAQVTLFAGVSSTPMMS
jgi:hypothetical protein